MSAGHHRDETLALRARAPSAKNISPSIAHEINNPLETLFNLLHIVEAEPTLSVEGRNYLRLAQEEVRRIAQIVQDTLGRCYSNHLPEGARIEDLLDGVLDFYEQRLDASGITLHRRYSGNGSIPVYAGELREVFSNLLLNAQAAMPEGGRLDARVSATHEWSGHARSGVRVTIADNGSGIPSNILPRIFQPFFTTKSRGNGMGLSLVKDIVHKHQGWLRVRSSTKLGRTGTVFAIFLPAA
jgi:two-component system, NtrC family, sensor kinase